MFKKYKNPDMIFLPIVVISAIVCLYVNMCDDLLSNEKFHNINDERLENIVSDITTSDKDEYRIAFNLSASSELVNKTFGVDAKTITLYSSTYNANYSDFFYYFNNNRASRNMFITGEIKK